MALIQALFAMVARSAGRLLNTVFGWATVLLFGRVPEDRQTYLSGVAFGSVLWLVALIGLAFPKAGSFLVAFVSPPDWLTPWIRIIMGVAVVVLPALVGWLSTRLVEPEDRPSTLRAIGRGYPYTIGLALTLVIMTIFAPVMKIRDMIRRWSSDHVPVVIPPEHYATVVDEVRRALDAGGLPTAPRRASWMLRFPTAILTWFARSSLGGVADVPLQRLVGERTQVLLHPSDLVISGREMDVAHARAVLAERLTVTHAYLTWTKEANEVEDEIRRAWHDLAAGDPISAADRLAGVERALHTLTVPYEEWDVLFRQTLLAQRELLARDAEVLRPALAERVVTALAATAPLLEEAESFASRLRSLFRRAAA
jgi:hypothetical protein